ncbi:MAG: alpha/beta fold hydrolase [Ilumatobacteraceae bacterium]
MTINILDTGAALGDAGDDAHPPLVLVHGFTGSAHDWVGITPALAVDRRLIAVEHRGHGDSPNHGRSSDYSFDLLVSDFEEAVDELQLAPFDLLGHSMGGIVAMRYTVAHPDAVASLILMDTSAEPTDIPGEVIDHLAEIGRAGGMGAVFDAINDFTGTAPNAEDRGRFARMDVEAFAALGHELGQYPSMLGELARVWCPTTVMVGADDHGLRDAAVRMHEAIDGSTLAVIEGAAHSPQTDQPDAWLAVVRAHLDRARQLGR